MSLRVKHDVVRLQVAENDVLGVQAFYRTDHLRNVAFGFPLTETTLQLKVLAQVATGAKLGDHEQTLSCLEGVLDFDNVGVIDLCHFDHDGSLGEHILEQVLAVDLLLAEHLHGIELLRGVLFDQVDLAEAARAQQLVSCEVLGTWRRGLN
jgi:hypothetical protein